MLLSLMQVCGLISDAFAKTDRNDATERIQALVKAETISSAVAQAIEEFSATLLILVTAFTVMTAGA